MIDLKDIQISFYDQISICTCTYHSVPGNCNVAARFYTNVCMEVKIMESTHVGRNRELYLSAHGCLPGTLQYS